MKPSEIGYQTDIVRLYVEVIRTCKTASALVTELEANWQELCPDALKQAQGITDDDWQFVLKYANTKKYAKKINDIAGAIFLPKTIMDIAMLSVTYCVPDGCAYIRMIEVQESSQTDAA